MIATDPAAPATANEIEAELSTVTGEIARVRIELRQEGSGPADSMVQPAACSLQFCELQNQQQDLAGLDRATAV